ncbi:4Fe-4S binding protein [bacterium]|nr:4Fe-4S binding protein [bacterium]
MLKQTGIPTKEDIEKILPSKQRREKGAYVVIECFEEIPCDPCTAACQYGAILQMENVNDLPEADYEKCNGCGICIGLCPGVAIFVVDETYSEEKALIKLPYEFTPLPNKGDVVPGLDRAGEEVCKAEVIRVQKHPSKTNIIWITVQKELAHEVRFIRIPEI